MSTKTEQTQLTKNLKSRLKQVFPKVKFSVKRGRGTSWGWIHVCWTDGVKERLVRNECASFLSDCSGIILFRHYSEAAIQQAIIDTKQVRKVEGEECIAETAEMFNNGDLHGVIVGRDGCISAQMVINRYLYNSDF